MVAESNAQQAVTRQLFGGAVTVDVPAGFEDVSVVREIPDNQEVFSQASTDRSVLIEMLELQDISDDSVLPAAFHMDVLAEESGAQDARTHDVVTLAPTDLPSSHRDDPRMSVSLAHATHVVSKFRDAAHLASTVNVYLARVRLPRTTTDLLVVFNNPVVLHPESSSARTGASVAADAADATRDATVRQAVRSLKIHDWSVMQ